MFPPFDLFLFGDEVTFLAFEERLYGMFGQKEMHSFLVNLTFLTALSLIELVCLLNSISFTE